MNPDIISPRGSTLKNDNTPGKSSIFVILIFKSIPVGCVPPGQPYLFWRLPLGVSTGGGRDTLLGIPTPEIPIPQIPPTPGIPTPLPQRDLRPEIPYPLPQQTHTGNKA